MNALELYNISKRFGNLQALTDVTLAIPAGSICALVGSNGAGKTTMFNIVNGLIAPDSGSLILNSQDITRLDVLMRATLGMGRLWQDLRILNRMTALENLCLATKQQKGEHVMPIFFAARKVTLQENDIRSRSLEILDFLGLEDKADSLAENLSYGQQKLLAIGRLLMNDATFLLLDEPFSGLSPNMIQIVMDKLKEIVNTGKTIFLIEHNLPKTLEIANRIYVLSAGKLVASATPKEFAENKSLLREVFVGV